MRHIRWQQIEVPEAILASAIANVADMAWQKLARNTFRRGIQRTQSFTQVNEKPVYNKDFMAFMCKSCLGVAPPPSGELCWTRSKNGTGGNNHE